MSDLHSTPKPRRSPTYCCHKASGQAVVRLSGRDFYLGPYGSEESHRRFGELVARWLAGGRCLVSLVRPSTLCVAELVEAFDAWAAVQYPTHHNGGERRNYLHAMRPLIELYATGDVHEFGPKQLCAVRERMISEGLSRTVVNRRIGRIRFVWRWAVAEGHVPAGNWQSLGAVNPLRKGQPGTVESPPVGAVPLHVVEATLAALSPTLADAVRVQLASAMRPGEVVGLHADQVDRSGDVWLFRPRTHKSAWRGRDRVVPLGPRAQAILSPRLAGGGWAFPSPKGQPYLRLSYAQAIRRACAAAGVPHWSPGQLRHTAATTIRRDSGIEAAQAVLGHSRIETTQLYADRLLSVGIETASRIG